MKINAVRTYAPVQNHKRTNSNQAMSSMKSIPSFQGHQFPSGEYSDRELEIAQKLINQTGDAWKETYRKENKTSFSEKYSNSPGLVNRTLGFFLRDYDSDVEDAANMWRVCGGLGTLGVWEIANSPFSFLEAKYKELKENEKIDKETKRIAALICDLRVQREESKINEALEKANQVAHDIAKKARFVEKQNILTNGFVQKINDEIKGETVEIPNVIMIEEKNNNWGKKLIDYTRRNSNTNYRYVPDTPDKIELLNDAVDNALENYKKTRRRTLIEVENFNELVDKDNTLEQIDWMKSLMDSCAEDSKVTIIFKTNNSSNIHHEAAAPHRIGLKVEC